MPGPKKIPSEYKLKTSDGTKRLDDKIKFHMNAAADIEQRGNPSGAKLPKVAAAMHKTMAKRYASTANKKTSERR